MTERMKQWANKRGAGKCGFAVLWLAGGAWPAATDPRRYARSRLAEVNAVET